MPAGRPSLQLPPALPYQVVPFADFSTLDLQELVFSGASFNEEVHYYSYSAGRLNRTFTPYDLCRTLYSILRYLSPQMRDIETGNAGDAARLQLIANLIEVKPSLVRAFLYYAILFVLNFLFIPSPKLPIWSPRTAAFRISCLYSRTSCTPSSKLSSLWPCLPWFLSPLWKNFYLISLSYVFIRLSV